MFKKMRESKKDGFVAVESVISMSFFLMFFFLVLGFYLFIHPQTELSRDVHALAVLAERQGGLTDEDVASFKSRISSKYSFVSPESIYVELGTENGLNAIQQSLSEKGEYINRESNDLMTLVVQTDSNNELLHNVTRFFGAGEKLGSYRFSETVYSERY